MMQIHSLSHEHSESPKSSESPQGSIRNKLRETLQDETQFESFMEWMYREFSSEAMLSAIELVQFRALLREYGRNADTAEEIIFYPEIPKSSIIHGVTGSTTVSQGRITRLATIAGALYRKYMDRQAELEVNISWPLRNRWDLLHFRNYPEDDMTELVSAIDDVIAEMFKYIRQSFVRFDVDRSGS